MAPLPPLALAHLHGSAHEPRDASPISPASLLLRLSARDLGPTQGQSVGMAVGLSLTGIIVAIFVFGWVRYIAAREHQRGAERRKAKEASEKKAAEEAAAGEAAAEEAPAE
ncbi:hypothetical protein DRE_07501 [Drechslerella stenobrocha 248]|uniref:Uncharacterized protein n=1 Tax=Drechslerella stenobrocha 248 TaxID=1043628 RepID=W7HI25_9PEZI|nr:hypothetical protein DRE_07501 [Drechslerella stenobrocha 248]